MFCRTVFAQRCRIAASNKIDQTHVVVLLEENYKNQAVMVDLPTVCGR
jgi:hypothetical protein